MNGHAESMQSSTYQCLICMADICMTAYQVMQSSLACTSNVHAWPFSDWVQAFKHLHQEVDKKKASGNVVQQQKNGFW